LKAHKHVVPNELGSHVHWISREALDTRIIGGGKLGRCVSGSKQRSKGADEKKAQAALKTGHVWLSISSVGMSAFICGNRVKYVFWIVCLLDVRIQDDAGMNNNMISWRNFLMNALLDTLLH
jgi:hypothetical protein